MRFILEIKFKGSRNYATGADMFNEIKNIVKREKKGFIRSINFRKITIKKPILLFDIPEETAQIVAYGKYIDRLENEQEKSFWLIESHESIVNRAEYEEEKIIQKASLREKSIALTEGTSFTFIENVVAMTKELSYKMSPNIDGKWLFGSLKLLEEEPQLFTEIKIIHSMLFENKFSTNNIIVDEKKLGEIRFIVGQA